MPPPGVHPSPDALLWNVINGANTITPIELYSGQLVLRDPNATLTPTPIPAPGFYCTPAPQA